MHVQTVIAPLTVMLQLVSGFLEYNINHLLTELDQRRQFNLSTIQEKWIEQPLDHQNPNDTRTLRMRYFENLVVWRQNGPIYIFITGEHEANSAYALADERLLMSQMAKETRGACYVTQHRYFGKSKPNITSNNIIEYYKFLSSQQVLSDLENFIITLKSDPKYELSKVVVVGGSYAGNLATWLRGRRPDLVDAAVASSAPVLAKKDFHEYLDGVRYTFDKYGTSDCLSIIEKEMKFYEKLLKSADGMDILKTTLNICPEDNLEILENQQYLFACLYSRFKTIAQHGTPDDIKYLCNTLKFGIELKPAQSLFYQGPTEFEVAPSCNTVNFSRVSFTKPWTSLACKEFGYLTTTSSEKQPFVHWNPLEFLLKYCKNVIEGDIERSVDEGVARTNRIYGGRSPQVSKVVFTNGDMDPWSALGVLRGFGPDAPAFVVNGTSHCAVLLVRPDEPKELTQNREIVKRIVKQWISTK